MFVPKFIPLFLLLLNVSCSEFSKNSTYYQKQTDRQPPRPYNRQPSEPKLAQDRFDINDNRKEKSFDIELSKSPNANEKQDKDKNSTIITLSSGFAVKSTNVKGKSISEDNLQIPVSVIYEEPVAPKIQKKILRRRKPNKQTTNASVKVIKSTTEPLTRPEYTTSTQKNTDNETTEKPSITTKQLVNDFKEQKKTRERAPVIPIIQSENRVFAHNGDFHYRCRLFHKLYFYICSIVNSYLCDRISINDLLVYDLRNNY